MTFFQFLCSRFYEIDIQIMRHRKQIDENICHLLRSSFFTSGVIGSSLHAIESPLAVQQPQKISESLSSWVYETFPTSYAHSSYFQYLHIKQKSNNTGQPKIRPDNCLLSIFSTYRVVYPANIGYQKQDEADYPQHIAGASHERCCCHRYRREHAPQRRSHILLHWIIVLYGPVLMMWSENGST